MTSENPTLRLVLLRHGESTWNELGLIQGHNDEARLTERGRTQARNAAALLASENIDVIFSSDLARAYETAGIVADILGHHVQTTTALRERSLGDLERAPFAEMTPVFSGVEHGVVVDPLARPNAGESVEDFYRRVAGFLDELNEERSIKRALLVTHGGTIRIARAYFSHAPLSGLIWDQVENCSIWPFDLVRD